MYLGKLCDAMIHWFILHKIRKYHLNLSIPYRGFSMLSEDTNTPIK